MKLDEKLVRLRKERGLTQIGLAEVMKVSRQAVSRWEVGDVIPSTENLKCLSELYGVPIDYLLNDAIECPGQSEVTGRWLPNTPPLQVKNRRIRKYAIVICLLILAVTTALLYRGTVHEKSKNLDFSEMGSEDWNNTEMDGFSVNW